jgi:hypothetical protein
MRRLGSRASSLTERRSEPDIDVVDLVDKGSTTEASKTRRTGPCIQIGSAVDDTVIVPGARRPLSTKAAHGHEAPHAHRQLHEPRRGLRAAAAGRPPA